MCSYLVYPDPRGSGTACQGLPFVSPPSSPSLPPPPSSSWTTRPSSHLWQHHLLILVAGLPKSSPLLASGRTTRLGRGGLGRRRLGSRALAMRHEAARKQPGGAELASGSIQQIYEKILISANEAVDSTPVIALPPLFACTTSCGEYLVELEDAGANGDVAAIFN